MTTKNKHITTKKGKTASSRVHTSRTRIKSSRRARSQSFSRTTYRTAKRAILAIIILAGMAVVLAAVSATFAQPQNLVTSKIEHIATDYYENYLYTRIAENSSTDKSVPEIMERYTTPGFSPVTLRQLLLYDDGRNSSLTSTLTAYCDENTTFIHIYPLAPFGKTDYRIDYHYDCNFE